MDKRRIVVCGTERHRSLIESGLAPTDLALLARSPAFASHFEHGLIVAAVIESGFGPPDLRVTLGDLARCGVPWPAVQILGADETRANGQASWAARAMNANDCRVHLASALRRAVIDWALADSASVVKRRFARAEVLCNLLQAALLGDPAIGSIVHLEHVTGYGHTALCSAWNEGMKPLCGLSLGEFLDWVRLVRALGYRAPGWGWRAIANRLDVGRKHLRDVARRRYGCTHTELADERGLAPVVEFVDRVLVSSGLTTRCTAGPSAPEALAP